MKLSVPNHEIDWGAAMYSSKFRAALVVALDYPDAQRAFDLALLLSRGLNLSGSGYAARFPALWVKVGLELFTAGGPDTVLRLKDMGFRVFLDMKFHDIPNTVRGAVRAATTLGVDMTNIHICGGLRMAEAALQGLQEGMERRGDGVLPLLLGVTVLTSAGPEDLDALGILDPTVFVRAGKPLPSPGDVALSRAACAKIWGLHGVVCSGHEVQAIKARLGRDFLCLTPGIRLSEGTGQDDQRRVMTPALAVAAGSDFLVVGRPITQAEDPVAVVAGILEEMGRATAD